jgi:hypothetical protein
MYFNASTLRDINLPIGERSKRGDLGLERSHVYTIDTGGLTVCAHLFLSLMCSDLSYNNLSYVSVTFLSTVPKLVVLLVGPRHMIMTSQSTDGSVSLPLMVMQGYLPNSDIEDMIEATRAVKDRREAVTEADFDAFDASHSSLMIYAGRVICKSKRGMQSSV